MSWPSISAIGIWGSKPTPRKVRYWKAGVVSYVLYFGMIKDCIEALFIFVRFSIFLHNTRMFHILQMGQIFPGSAFI